MLKQFSFGVALEQLKKGKRVTRPGWNGKGMWLILVEPEEWYVEAYKYFNAEKLLPFIAMRTADGGLVPWLASQTDILAEDWESVE